MAATIRKSVRAAIALLFALSCAYEVSGNNNLFLPGDAFFPTELTEADLIAFQSGEGHAPRITYSALGGYNAAFCGYAGYMNANVPQLNAAFLKNLRQAYANVRELEPREFREEVGDDGKRRLVETNGIRVLFYPADFDFPKLKLGLRYNEDWVERAQEFGHQRSHLRLCNLVDDADAVMECWRDASTVAPLPADLPNVELKPVPETTAPVTLRGPLKAIVLDSRPLTDYYRPKDDITVLAVDVEGIREWRYTADEGWEQSNSND